MDQPQDVSQPVQARLGLWDAVSIIIGIVIGAGLYETPPGIFLNVSGPWAGLGVWALGGVLALVGALCYAELATTYPRSGGDYVYLSRAYGSWMGFLFAWIQLTVVRSGNIGMMAYVFADYAIRYWNLGGPLGWSHVTTTFVYATLAVLVLTGLNLLGVVFGKGTQNVLTGAKVLGLCGILVAGLLAPPSPPATPAVNADPPSFGFAMILILYTYGGWNDAAFVAAEQRNPRRNIPLALILGTALITLIYLLVNGTYLYVLGFEGARKSRAIAADVLEHSLGPAGSGFISLLVMVSALGAMNAMIFTGSRIYSAMGREHSLFAWLGQWDPQRGSPVNSLVTQLAITLVMILAVGTDAGRAGINNVLTRVGLTPKPWEGRSGFSTLLDCTAPAFWLFFLLTAVALFVLRMRDRHLERPFTVPFYPLLPLIFCGTCAYMLYSSTVYAGALVLPVVILLLAGLPLHWLSRRSVSAEGPVADGGPG